MAKSKRRRPRNRTKTRIKKANGKHFDRWEFNSKVPGRCDFCKEKIPVGYLINGFKFSNQATRYAHINCLSEAIEEYAKTLRRSGEKKLSEQEQAQLEKLPPPDRTVGSDEGKHKERYSEIWESLMLESN